MKIHVSKRGKADKIYHLDNDVVLLSNFESFCFLVEETLFTVFRDGKHIEIRIGRKVLLSYQVDEDIEAGAEQQVDRCRVCGCTDLSECDGGCFWVEPGLCSQCHGLFLSSPAEPEDQVDGAGAERRRGCPKCGSEEIESDSPRTTYSCGSSDYDQRPGTFQQSICCCLVMLFGE